MAADLKAQVASFASGLGIGKGGGRAGDGRRVTSGRVARKVRPSRGCVHPSTDTAVTGSPIKLCAAPQVDAAARYGVSSSRPPVSFARCGSTVEQALSVYGLVVPPVRL